MTACTREAVKSLAFVGDQSDVAQRQKVALLTDRLADCM
jgi:hypothetical protein